jgi:hypothetical protein
VRNDEVSSKVALPQSHHAASSPSARANSTPQDPLHVLTTLCAALRRSKRPTKGCFRRRRLNAQKAACSRRRTRPVPAWRKLALAAAQTSAVLTCACKCTCASVPLHGYERCLTCGKCAILRDCACAVEIAQSTIACKYFPFQISDRDQDTHRGRFLVTPDPGRADGIPWYRHSIISDSGSSQHWFRPAEVRMLLVDPIRSNAISASRRPKEVLWNAVSLRV